jgi:protein-disulfide isomerase
LSQIRKNYIDNGKVKLVYRDFPLDLHQNARKAAEAAECADEQGKFWEFHDKLYENQNSLDNESLKQYAKDMGLNTNQFNTCLDSGKMTQEVLKDFEDGSSYGVTGTPTLFINGIKVVGAQPYEFFKKIIDQELISNIS